VYILYLDESGDENNPADRHFVLAGAAVFERQTYFLSSALDAVQAQHLPGAQNVQFHASHIRSGMRSWRRVPRPTREAVLRDVAAAIRSILHPGLVLFGAVVDKSDTVRGEHAVRLAAEQICRRFDIFLMRRNNEEKDPQRGLLVFAEGRFHEDARVWVQGFRNLGTQWGVLRNLSDIPYFASTAETRLLQAADFVAYAVYRLYAEQDPTLVAPILHRFDQKDGTLHGLVHLTKTHAVCPCPACSSRASPGQFGPWVS
jgi:hypothetical protein